MKCRTALISLIPILILGAGIAQIPGLGGGGLPGVDSLFKEEPPITTALTDAVTEIPFLDEFSPASAIDMSILKKSGGAFRLAPGDYAFEGQSYCMHAGTHGPGSGEGYLYAPLKGPKSSLIRNILVRSNDHSDIPQHDIQVLIWGILARTKPSQMQGTVKQTATTLLTPQEMASLESGGLDFLQDNVTNRLFGSASSVLRPIYEAENKLRRAMSVADQPYEEMERVAVLTGEYKPRKNDREIPRGRWSYHQDGYFVRYFPHGYNHTSVGVHMPQHFSFMRDPSGTVTGMSDASGYKLQLSGSELTFSNKLGPIGTISFAPSKADQAKRKSELDAIAKKMKKPLLAAQDLPVIADFVTAIKSAPAEWRTEALEFAYSGWMSAFTFGTQGLPSGVFASLSAFGSVQGGSFDPSGSVAAPGQTGRQRLAQSSRCNPQSPSGQSPDLQKSVVDAMREKGYQVSNEHVYVYDQRPSGGLLRFVVRMGHNNNPLPTGQCIEERIQRGEVPPGSLEGAKELLFGSVQEAGDMKRIGVRTVDVETGVVTGAGKGDGNTQASASNNAFQNYRRW
ncbi:MAG: hypothetical protein U0R49_07135 [Fimbriimonadales bacterium]